MRDESQVETVRVERRRSQSTGLPWLWLTLAAIIADQASKIAVVARFELFETVRVLPVLNFTYLHNPGAAFSFLATAGGWQRWMFTGLALVVSVAIIYWLKKLHARQRMVAIGLALVMGGAVGNVIDRLRLGHVVDFIHVHWKAHYFPAFNLADTWITIGAGLLLLDAFLESRRKVKED